MCMIKDITSTAYGSSIEGNSIAMLLLVVEKKKKGSNYQF